MTEVLGTQLPSGWSSSRLKFVTSVLRRGSAPVYADSGPVRAISQAANQDGGLDWTRTRFHDYEGNPERLKGFLLPGDVLVNSTGRGTLGRIGFFTSDPVGYPCMADGHVTVARFDTTQVDCRFAYYWMGSRPFYDYIYATLVIGATNQIELSREGLADAPVPLPLVEEQRRIADFLDAETSRMDRLAKSRKKQLSLIWERLDAVAKEATGRTSLRANADRTPTKLGRALVMMRTGTTPSHLEDASNGNSLNMLPWYTPAALDGALQVSPAEKKAKDDGHVPVFPAGSILVTGIGESLGKIGYLTHEATGNQQLTALFPASTSNGRFIAWQLHAARDDLRSWAQYSRVRIINNDTLANFPISLPVKSVQDNVAARLDEDLVKASSLNAATDEFIAAIRERRQALITAAVTGQFDVSTASGRGVME